MDFDSFAEQLEAAVFATADALSGPGPRRYAELVRRLSEAYNAEQRSGDQLGDRLAQLVFYTLTDFPKTTLLLRELWQRCGPPPRPQLRVLDLGAGSGAQSFGLLAALSERGQAVSIDLTAVDSDPRRLEQFATVLKRLSLPKGLAVDLDCRAADATAALAGSQSFDLVLVGTLLAELPVERHLPLISTLVGRLASDGALLIIEPALKETARQLQALRDRLLAERIARVIGPCSHLGDCPASAQPRDWCHQRRAWQPTPRLRQLIRTTGLRGDALLWSYLTLVKADRPVDAESRWRVVSEVIQQKGKSEAFLCGPAGRRRFYALKRDRQRAFRRLHRGDLVQIGNLPSESSAQLRLSSDAELEVFDPYDQPEKD